MQEMFDRAIIGFDLSRKPDVQLIASITQTKAFYLAELFVQSDKRRHGLGRKLINQLIKQVISEGYLSVALRTSASPWLIEMYSKLGFRIVGEQQVTTIKKIAGQELKLPDDRVIMINDLYST